MSAYAPSGRSIRQNRCMNIPLVMFLPAFIVSCIAIAWLVWRDAKRSAHAASGTAVVDQRMVSIDPSLPGTSVAMALIRAPAGVLRAS